jgi:bifunctional UDP-N-acetylglucosamine pyrophosphorylase/glucosamine-1-phosphate N-acetyltransferase
MKALILAGGRSPNMAPFSATRPNPTLPVGETTVIDHMLCQLKQAGVNLAHVVVGHKSERLAQRLPIDHPSGVKVHLVDQGKGNTIGAAALAAADRFVPGEHFMLVYADTFTATNIFANTLQAYSLHNEPTAAICHTSATEKYGAVYLAPDAVITKIVEKPSKAEGLHNYVLAGVFVVSSSLFDHLRACRGDMAAAMERMMKKETVRAAIWEDDWLDLANPWDILTANRYAMGQWTEARINASVAIQDAEIRGPVRIQQGVTIRSGVSMEGPVFIGAGSTIGHGALIRPYTFIGPGSVVGQGAELKNCVLFENVTVGRLSFIGDSVIGAGVELGAGCMTINHSVDFKNIKVRINRKNVDSGLSKIGAFIGDGALIGASNILAAGAVVDAGTTIDHNVSVR